MQTGSASKNGVIWGAAIIVFHLLVSLVHGAAHLELHIELNRADSIFVVAVIGLCPLIAIVLLWTSRTKAGFALLALSMAGALAFGILRHFLRAGADQVGRQVPGWWAFLFAASAYGLAITEVGGVYVGVRFLLKRNARN